MPTPLGVELLDAIEHHGVEALVTVQDEVFGGDHSAMAEICWPGSDATWARAQGLGLRPLRQVPAAYG